MPSDQESTVSQASSPDTVSGETTTTTATSTAASNDSTTAAQQQQQLDGSGSSSSVIVTNNVDATSSSSTPSLKRTSDHLDLNEPSSVISESEYEEDSAKISDPITFTVVYMKEKHEFTMSSGRKVQFLKNRLEAKFGVQRAAQKLLYSGKLLKDESTLKEFDLKSGAKVILMGSQTPDIVRVSLGEPATKDSSVPETTNEKREPLCKQLPHKKIIEKGKPPDALPAFKNVTSNLPREPLCGMYNRKGGKVRLTFKLELDQLWIGTKERTEKINMSSIHNVISEPIADHEEYHMIALQLGPTEASRYWIYWVPAQYVAAIRQTILGD